MKKSSMDVLARVKKDFLTNCYERDGLVPLLTKLMADHNLTKKPFSVLLMDVDHFKTYNDKYGHLYGDEVLKHFSSCLRLDLEDEENFPFRFGGDEFVVVFPEKTSVEANRLAQRLKKNLRIRSFLLKGRRLKVSFSGGIATYPTDAKNIEDVIEKADKAMYFSKKAGRDRITQFKNLFFLKAATDAAVVLFAVLILLLGVLVFHENIGEYVRLLIEEKKKQIVLAEEKKREKLWQEAQAVKPAPIPVPDVTPAPGTSVVRPPVDESKIMKVIYLKAGGKIRGRVADDKDDEVVVELALKEGEGILRVKKADILKIENEPGG